MLSLSHKKNREHSEENIWTANISLFSQFIDWENSGTLKSEIRIYGHNSQFWFTHKHVLSGLGSSPNMETYDERCATEPHIFLQNTDVVSAKLHHWLSFRNILTDSLTLLNVDDSNSSDRENLIHESHKYKSWLLLQRLRFALYMASFYGHIRHGMVVQAIRPENNAYSCSQLEFVHSFLCWKPFCPFYLSEPYQVINVMNGGLMTLTSTLFKRKSN